MAAFFQNLRNVVIAGCVLLVLFVAFAMSRGMPMDHAGFGMAIMVWAHVISGIMWIGHLYYFNFTQIPNMPKIPDEQKPAISKVIAPAALFWFRWGAVATLVTGLLVAGMKGYLVEALTFQAHQGIGIGMWLATIMFLNVWLVIWPNQKRALGIVEATPEVKAASAKTAMMFSRTNTMLSIPMLFGMVSQGIYPLS